MTAAAVAALVAAGAACGSGGGADGDEVASLGTDDASDESTATTDGEVTEQDREEAMLAFAECMREQGVDMPDPQTDGGGVAIAIENDDLDPGEFEAAHETCQPLLDEAMGDIEIDPERQAEMQEQLLEYAQCMRDHGIDMPDPEFDGGRITMSHGGDVGDGSEFAAADAECATGDMPGGPPVGGASTERGGGSQSDGGGAVDEGPSVVIGGGDG